MFDSKQLLNQFLGGDTGTSMRAAAGQAKNYLDNAGGTKSFAGGAALGGILGMVLGGGKSRKLAGGLLSHGGAAAIGALALRAYQNYQQQQAPAAASPMTSAEVSQVVSQVTPQQLPHSKPAADGGPFELVLIRAMVGAAKADGHIDSTEQQHLFTEVERMALDPEAKAFVFDLLTRPVELAEITGAVTNEAQASEVYLAARLAIDPDQPAERMYLDALAVRMKLPAALREHLERQLV
jgi:uncharacterized membrane protein YebE (DUF533 family)